MSETKHTPGPWKTSYTNLSVVIAENGAVVARASKLNGLVNLQANARLIAAAPELLEALESIASMYDYEASCGDLASRLYEATCLARAAIAKATGEQQ